MTTCYWLQVQFPEGTIIFATARAGSNTLGITNLSKYPDQFSNVSIRPVVFPLLMYKFLVSVNKVDSHNSNRNPDIVLEKLWVTQCGWLRLCTNIAMGMVITNFYKLFRYGVKRDRHDKFISIREFSE